MSIAPAALPFGDSLAYRLLLASLACQPRDPGAVHRHCLGDRSVASPAPRRFKASACWCLVSFGLRPNPFAFGLGRLAAIVSALEDPMPLVLGQCRQEAAARGAA